MSKKKRKKFKRKPRAWASAFAPIYPDRQGTPMARGMGGPAGMPSGPFALSPATAGIPGMQVASRIAPSRHRVLHELKQAMRSVKEAATNPAYTGYVGMIPGSQRSSDYDPAIPEGGKYNFRDSPGIGLKTEYAWKVWRAALVVMGRDATLPKSAILMAAFATSGIPMAKIDPSEVRLLEMGVEWYLNDRVGTPAVVAPVPGAPPGSGPR